MRVSVYIAMSLDGYIAREDGDINWLHECRGNKHSAPNSLPADDYGYENFINSIDVIVMGKNSFLKVLTFDDWPYVGKRVFVLTTHGIDIPEYLAETVTATSEHPQDLVKRLSQQNIQRVYLDGGTTIQGFLYSGVVTDLIITIIPIILGGGISLFGVVGREIPLILTGAQPYSSGLVQLTYDVSN